MKKGFRQLLSILTTLVMLCGAIPTGAFAEDSKDPSTSYSGQVALPVVPKKTEAPADAATKVTVRFAYGDETFDLVVDQGATVDTEKQGPDPTREGYVFTGWSLDGQTVSILEDIQQDTTLTAQYVQLFTITFENWDGTELAKVPSVHGGTKFTSDAYYDGTRVNPSRDGYRFLRWEPETIENVDGDATIMATFTALVQHTVTINYVFENQRQAESPFVATVSDGYSLDQTVPSPAVQGYSPDAGQESIILSGPVTEDQTYTVLYRPNGSTRYEVHYLLQNLTDDGYTLDATHTEIRSGVTGSMTDVRADNISAFTGFSLVTDLHDVNDAIAADESTVIELRFNRDVHYVMFDTADGQYIAPQVDRYGTPVREYSLHTTPTRAGYSFSGWEPEIPATIGTKDVTITAEWDAQLVPYTVVFWIQNPDDDNYSYAGYQTLTGKSSKPAGTVLSSPGAYYSGSLSSYVKLREQNACDTVTIKGDGSTVQNVYYDRNLYTLSFDLNSNDSNLYLVANGVKYYAKKTYPGASKGISYQIRARYDASILSLWPSSVSDNSFQGWDSGRWSSGLFASKRPTLNAELLDYWGNGYTFTATYQGTVLNTLVYILEDTHGNFVQDHSLDQQIASSASRWEAKEISGFTNIGIDQGTVHNNARTRTFTYSRNKVNLRLKNGDTITTESNIYFGASLAPYADKYAAPSRPTGIDPDYIFTGWYTEAGCNEASKLDWATAVMPFDGLMLYAGWKNPTYTLTFYLQDPQTGLYQTQTVERKGIATTFVPPTKEGYQFDYWYYRDPQTGLTKLYNFSMPITQALELYAHWSPMTVAYTVQYLNGSGKPVFDESGKTVLTAKPGSGKVGELVTETAVSAFSSSKKALFPESVSSSITLQSDPPSNTITFRYHELPSVYYLVRYVDESGNELRDAKGPIETTNTRVTENYLNINGYSPDVYQQTVMLAGETDPQQVTENVIIFTYHPNPKGTYQVRYYLQNLNDNGYTLQDTQAMSDAPLGSTAHAEIRTYEGFYYVPGVSVDSGVVYSSTATPLILSVYYNRKLIAYTAGYLDHDATPAVKIAEDSIGFARYGRSVTLYAKTIPGYTLDTSAIASPVTLTMQADETLNHVDFYYNVQEGLAVTIRFLDESGAAIADAISITGRENQNVRLNATFRYALADLQRTIRYQNTETFRLRSDESTEKSVTVTAGDNYIDYIYVPDTFHVTYDANGGTNPPADSAAYRVNALVTLSADAPTYGEYRFEGWSLNEAVRGQVYRTAEALQAEEARRIDGSFRMPEADQTLYAVWSYIDVTLSYRSDEPYTGTLPAAHTVPVQQPTAVAGNDTFARTGYTFAGWKQHDAAGNPVGLAYGTGSGMTREIVLQADTVLYATWSPVGYAVTYNSNLPETALARLNWNGAPASYTVESAAITLPTPTCTGYAFDGWYLDGNGTVAAATPAIPAQSTGERTFYARFSPAQVQSFRVENYNGTYDGRAHGITFHADALFDGDTVSYDPANAFIHVTDTPQTVTVTVRRDQVVIWSGTGTVQIGKRQATLTAESINELYNGTAYTLAVQVAQGVANETDRAAILASLTFTRQGAQVDNRFTDAMAQTTITVSANHPDYTITPAEPTVAIRKRPLTVTGETRSYPYDGQEHALANWTVEAPTATTGLVGSDAVNGVYWSGNSRTDVGTSYPAIAGITLSTGNLANYQPMLNAGTLTITRRSDLTLNLSAGAGTYPYDRQEHGFEADTAGVPVTLSYRLTGSAWKQVDAQHPLPSFTNAGTYTLQVKAESPNYDNTPTAEATLTILKRTVRVLGGTLNKAYNGNEHTLTSWSVAPTDATTGLIGSDTITEVKWANNKRTAPGTATATLSVSAWSESSNPDNYTLETTAGTLTVTASADAPTLTAPDVTLLYDDRPHRLTYEVTVPDDCPYTLYYRTSTDDPWQALRKNDRLPEQTEAGEYPVYLRLTSDYYAQSTEMTATLHILRRPLLLSVVSETRTGYNGKPVTAGYTMEPESDTGGLLVFHQLEATLLNATQTAAGTYIVTFLESDTYIRHGNKNVTANYDIQYQSGQIVIGSAASQASATEKAVVYNGAAQTFTEPVLLDAAGKPVPNVTLAWSLENLAADAPGWQAAPLPMETEVKGYEADGTTAAAYQIYVRLSNPNYQSAVVTATLRIDPAAVTLTADRSMDNPYTLNADGTAKTWSVSTAHWAVTGLAQDVLYAGDRMTYALSNNTQSEVGDGHAVTFSAYGVQPEAHAKNYRITPVDGWIRVVRSTAQSTLAHPGLSFTYDAQAHTLPMPTVSVATEGDGLPVDRTASFTFQYTVTHNGVETEFTQAPAFTEAGAYSVTIQANSTVYANPEPLTLTVTVDRRMLTLTSGTVQAQYDAQPHSAPILSLVSNVAPDTDHAVRASALTLLAGQTATATLAGVYPVQIDPQSVRVFSGTAEVTANYQFTSVAGALTITAAAVPADALPLADVTVVYDGTAHSLTLPTTYTLNGVALDLTDTQRFTVAYQEKDATDPAAVWSDSTTNPSYTNASAHDVRVLITDLTGSLTFAPLTGRVTVEKRRVTITPNSGAFDYDGTPHVVLGHDHPVAQPGSDTGFVQGDDVTVTLLNNRQTDAGTYEIRWQDPTSLTQGDLDNYTLVHATGTLTIRQATALALQVQPQSGVYDAQTHSYTFTTAEPNTEKLTLAYSLDGALWTTFTDAADLPSAVDAGEYQVRIRASSPNFTAEATQPATLRITARPVTLTPQSDAFDYDGTAKSLSVCNVERAVLDAQLLPLNATGLLGTDDVTLTWNGNGMTDAGAYAVTCGVDAAVGATKLSNYAFQSQTGTLTVRKIANPGFTLTAEPAVYDAQPHGFAFGTTAVGAYTLEYSTDGLNWTAFTTAAQLPTRTDAGTLQLTVRLSNNNYTTPTTTGSALLSIDKRPLTLTVVGSKLAYDGQPHSLQLLASGLATGDALDTYQLNPASATNPGSTLMQVVEGNTGIVSDTRPGNQLGNYTVTPVAGTLSLIDLALTPYNGTYDGQPHGVTAAWSETYADHYTLTYTVDGVAVEGEPSLVNAGSYAVVATAVPNDATEGLPSFTRQATVQIADKAISMQVDPIQKTYDGVDASLHITLPANAAANQNDADTLLSNIRVLERGIEIRNHFLNAGTWNLTVDSACDNYTVTPVAANVNIAKRPLTLTAGSASKAYDEQPVTVGYSYNTAQYSGTAVLNAQGLLKQHTLAAALLNQTQTDICNQVEVTFQEALTSILEGTTLVRDNYAITYQTGHITITQPASLTLALRGVQTVYDGQPHAVEIVSVMDGTRSVAMDRFNWSFGLSADAVNDERLTRTDVCDLTVYVVGRSKDLNYPNVSGSAKLTITARPVQVQVGNLETTYDGQLKSITAFTPELAQSSGGRGLLGTDQVSVTLTNASQTLPGTYDVGWTNPQMTSGTASNYQFEEVKGQLRILKASQGLTIAAEDTEPVYDALAHRLAYTVTAPVGCLYTVEYSTDNGQHYQSLGADGLLPALTQAGSISYLLRVTSPYYVDGYAATAQATLTVQKRPLTVTGETNSFVYDTLEHTVNGLQTIGATTAQTGLVNDGAGTVHRIAGFAYAPGLGNSQTVVGGHAVRVLESSLVIRDQANADVTANYSFTLNDGRIDVTAQQTGMAATARSAIYNGQPQGFTLPTLLDASGSPVTEPVSYKYSTDGIQWSSTPMTFENVQVSGPYTVSIRAESPNYTPATVSATLDILPAPLTVAVDSTQTFVYALDGSGDPMEWTLNRVTTAGTLYKAETVAAQFANNTRSDVGSQPVTLQAAQVMLNTVDVSTNYDITLVNGTLTVFQGTADAYLLTTPLQQTYNGTAYTLPQPKVYVQTQTDDYLDRTANYSFQYSITKQGSSDVRNVSNTLPTFRDAGIYTVAITATSTRLTSPVTGTEVVTIAQRPVTIASGDNRVAPYTYKAEAQSVEAALVTGGDLALNDAIGATFFSAGFENTATDVCDRAVTLTSVRIVRGSEDVTDNYAVTLGGGWIQILPKTVSDGLTLTGATHVYSGGPYQT
ncbi:MAG: InlB B-repeat-containing protein, partial [Candidatus Limiplasma sp.]|nr:InlB B-repeat-containing protein [Candidatus Limiplasma sp.]